MTTTTTHKKSTSRAAGAAAAPELLTGVVEKVHISRDTFSAGRISTPTGHISFRAKFPTTAGQRYTMRGEWVTDPTYGKQFAAHTLVYEQDTTAAGLAHWLATNPAFFGIGPVKAGAIAREFAENFDEAIRTRPHDVQRAAKLTGDQVATLQREWIASADRNALYTWLAQFELTQCQMEKLVETYGDRTRAALEAEPYTLCREVRGYGFARTDVIALRMGTPRMAPTRIRACLNDVAYGVTDEGHCWIEANDLLRTAEDKLGISTTGERDTIKSSIMEMCAEGTLSHERDAAGVSRFASPAIYRAEQLVAMALRTAPAVEGAPTDDQFRYLLDVLPDLNDTQQRAVRMAISSRVCVVAGEAGTGKSYTINAIRRAFHLRGKTVLMAAPTGKAAKRMEELCSRDAMVADGEGEHRVPAFTVHRALGYDPSAGEGDAAWGYNHNNPLECDVLILDETGMLDILLAARVFDALDLTRTHLVIVGDHQQLPPVGPGNLLRDLLSAGGAHCPVIILDQVMRQAGVLKANSVAVLHGHVPDTAPGEPGTLRPWYRLSKLETPEQILATLLHVIEHELPKTGIQASDVSSWQVLTPQHNTSIGTIALNLHLQRLVQRIATGRDLPEVIADAKGKYPRAKLYPRDRVINTRNNYALGVMNGASGLVVATDCDITDLKGKRHEHGVQVDFGDPGRPEIIGYYGDFLADLQLAYALTVHKAQGSEYPVSLVICSRAHSFMMNRNLIYTAVTRARQSCVIIGDSVAMQRAMRNTQTAARRTWLSVWGDKPAALEAAEKEL